jgi:chromate transport protein ChrA
MENKASLKDIAKLFLKLGVIGFGGPAAHIALMCYKFDPRSQQHRNGNPYRA